MDEPYVETPLPEDLPVEPLEGEAGLMPDGLEPDVIEPSGIDWRTTVYEIFETLVIAVVLFMVINALTARIRVDGVSMLPSLQNRDHVIVWRMAYKFSEIERGDVIVFELQQASRDDYIKRVIAVPGDTIEILNGITYVNDVPLDEPYIAAQPVRDFPTSWVRDGYVFVMGDNRNDSSDSRSWGLLPIEDITGRAVFVYWPLADWGSVAHQALDMQVANGQGEH